MITFKLVKPPAGAYWWYVTNASGSVRIDPPVRIDQAGTTANASGTAQIEVLFLNERRDTTVLQFQNIVPLKPGATYIVDAEKRQIKMAFSWGPVLLVGGFVAGALILKRNGVSKRARKARK